MSKQYNSYTEEFKKTIVLKKYNHAGNKKVDDINKPNLLEQDFKATKPKEKWVGDYEELLKTLNIKHSYSKKGYPYDNASMESFNAILKKEEVNQRSYVTYEKARLAIFEFI